MTQDADVRVLNHTLVTFFGAKDRRARAGRCAARDTHAHSRARDGIRASERATGAHGARVRRKCARMSVDSQRRGRGARCALLFVVVVARGRGATAGDTRGASQGETRRA